MGSIVGGILGGGSSPGQQAQMAGIKGSVDDYQTYRQEMAQALLNTLNTANSAYQGTSNALETLYGAPAQKPVGMGRHGAWDASRNSPQSPPGPSPGGTGGSPMGMVSAGGGFLERLPGATEGGFLGKVY